MTGVPIIAVKYTFNLCCVGVFFCFFFFLKLNKTRQSPPLCSVLSFHEGKWFWYWIDVLGDILRTAYLTLSLCRCPGVHIHTRTCKPLVEYYLIFSCRCFFNRVLIIAI